MANKKKGTTKKHYVGTDPHKWEGISSSYEAIYRDSSKKKPTKKAVKQVRKPRKKSPPFGVTPKDVKRTKVRRSAQKMADVEKGVTQDVKRGKKYSRIAKIISETGGLRGKIARGALSLQGVIGDTTYKEAIKRGKAQGAKARKEARTATDRSGKEHMDPYGLIRKSITGKNRKGGTVKRKAGGKIMQGYKAGGKV